VSGYLARAIEVGLRTDIARLGVTSAVLSAVHAAQRAALYARELRTIRVRCD
jgi:hypothetical protein